MIFNHKPLDEITDDEIKSLVDKKISERQHLEFKATINNRDDDDRLELLKDITSLANGGGGYLIIGIKDDGKGRAIDYATDRMGDTNQIKQSIRDLCVEHISERIEGLDIDPYSPYKTSKLLA